MLSGEERFVVQQIGGRLGNFMQTPRGTSGPFLNTHPSGIFCFLCSFLLLSMLWVWWRVFPTKLGLFLSSCLELWSSLRLSSLLDQRPDSCLLKPTFLVREANVGKSGAWLSIQRSLERINEKEMSWSCHASRSEPVDQGEPHCFISVAKYWRLASVPLLPSCWNGSGCKGVTAVDSSQVCHSGTLASSWIVGHWKSHQKTNFMFLKDSQCGSF